MKLNTPEKTTLTPFELFRSGAGDWSARHGDTGVLLHSSMDPQGEGRQIAHALATDSTSGIWIIGDGLGYLSNALRKLNRDVKVIEPFPNTRLLAAESCVSQDETRVIEMLEDLLRKLSESEQTVYLAPYVRSLIDLLPRNVARCINEIAVLCNSREEYATLIRRNIRSNSHNLRKVPLLQIVETSKMAIACGSGPSLMPSIESLKAARESFALVACSSSVPLLVEHGVVPDWIVALEAHQGVARDLDALPDGARVVVFEWTDPDVFNLSRLNLMFADEKRSPLETGGGTTLLTAADLAARITLNDVYLVGADLSWSSGLHADEPASEIAASERRSAPKFAVMRDRIEQWIERQNEKRIWHVIADRKLLLRGTQHATPNQLTKLLCEVTDGTNIWKA